ncbi:MAG TPA: hypothetical protein VFQ77_22555 [Pseudonocardiaceae bacterium]|jgi:hypothetical protein|nr:hypothetical protein [Pseudonocardiaceae bacterium]
MTSLISQELGQMLALRRVHRGHVILSGRDLFLDHGRPVPSYLRPFLHELIDDGHLRLGAQRAECDQWPVLMTATGVQLQASLENPEGRLTGEADAAQ